MKVTTESGFSRRSIPEGTHVGTLVQIIDLGEQLNLFSEVEGATQRKLYLTFEIPSEKLDDGRPMVIGKELTASFHSKSRLRPIVESLLGRTLKEGDLADATQTLKATLGKSAFVEVEQVATQKGGKFSKIKNIMKLSKGLSVESPYNDLLFFDLDDENAEQVLENLPRFIQNKIASGIGRVVPNTNSELDL